MKIKPEYISFTNTNRTLSDAISIYEQRIKDALDVYSIFEDDFYLRPCPVCGNKGHQEIDKFHGAYGIVKCNYCSSVYINPCPTLDTLNYYYNNCACNEMLGEVYRKRTSPNNFIITGRTAYLIDLIKKLLNSRKEAGLIKILEIGCGSGVFLSELKAGLSIEGLLNQCELQGVDIDQNAIKKSVDSDLNLFAESVEEFSKNNTSKFDMVIHFELIEHLSDPFQFMTTIYQMLKPSGIHHFHTPNALGMDNVVMNWNSTRLLAHGIFPPMHINAFTTQNIVHFALRSKFRVLLIDTPGKFDVDIVRLMLDEVSDESSFKEIKNFSDEQLAVIQTWLQLLNACSHMRVTLER